MVNYDQSIEADANKDPQSVFYWIIITSYLYYIADEYPILSDEAFDRLCRFALDRYDVLDNPLKPLCGKDNLKAASLYNLRAHDYPSPVCQQALYFSKACKNGVSFVTALEKYKPVVN